jgi:hypothetical protein
MRQGKAAVKRGYPVSISQDVVAARNEERGRLRNLRECPFKIDHDAKEKREGFYFSNSSGKICCSLKRSLNKSPFCTKRSGAFFILKLPG